MADVLKPNELINLPLLDLARIGIEQSYSLSYRIEVAKRLAQATNCSKVLLFDDVAYAVPEAQRPGLKALPGYERALLPALLLAPGFEKGASVLVAAPPNPIERDVVLKLKQKLEQELGQPVAFQILFEQNGRLIDILQLSNEEYKRMCENYAQRLNDPCILRKYKEDYHLNLILNHPEIFEDGKTFVFPFQSTIIHQQRLTHLIKDGKIFLPSVPEMDKVLNNFRLKEFGFNDVHEIIAVFPDGQLAHNLQELEEIQNQSPNETEASDENIRNFAVGILNALEELAKKGKKGYIKLDSNGVSGLGNLPPSNFPEIYDQSKPFEERLKILIREMKKKDYKTLPQRASVEEFVVCEIVGGIKHDITVGGIMINGVFLPFSINPFGVNRNDEYIYSWMAANPEEIGEKKELQERLFNSFSNMGNVLANFGYINGILAGDTMVDENEKIYVHDFNFRRGGRSFLEALSVLIPEKGWFEAQIVVELPFETDNLQRFNLYSKIIDSLYQKFGIIPYSTSFGYFGGDHNPQKPDFLKFKLAAPTEIFNKLSRNEFLPYLEYLVLEELMRILVEIKTEGNVWPPYSAYNLAASCYPLVREGLDNTQCLKCCDVGTGSGILAVLGGKWFPESKWIITDLNPEAVKQATENWKRNGLSQENITPLVCDGISYELIELAKEVGGFDILVANLPQQPLVNNDELEAIRERLFQQRESDSSSWNIDPSGDPDGLGLFIEVLTQSPEIMKKGGFGFFTASSKQNVQRWKKFLDELLSSDKIQSWEIVSSCLYPIPETYDQKIINHWLIMQEKDGIPRIIKGEDGKYYYIHYNLLIRY